MIGVLPIGQRQTAFFWSLRADDHEALKARGYAAWAETVRGLWPETAPHVEAIRGWDALTLARYAHHTMAVPAEDGIVHIGDSAHSTSPQLGQGANMALLDARALFLALRDAGDLADGLSRYVRFRRWHVRLYQALSAAFTPFYQSDSVVLPWIRDVLVSSLARIPPAPQFLAAMVAGTVLFDPIRALGLQAPFGMSGQT
jgi:2-polyprenyl-6-methoxyphenol hydroxylase-like FAD-dependent oxidoreductase